MRWIMFVFNFGLKLLKRAFVRVHAHIFIRKNILNISLLVMLMGVGGGDSSEWCNGVVEWTIKQTPIDKIARKLKVHICELVRKVKNYPILYTNLDLYIFQCDRPPSDYVNKMKTKKKQQQQLKNINTKYIILKPVDCLRWRQKPIWKATKIRSVMQSKHIA